MTGIRTYRDLIAWQKAMDLAEMVYSWTAGMPSEERFGLTQQIRRAAVAVPSDIAEGYGRATKADYLRFLRVARGSLCETETQAELIRRLRMLEPSANLRDLFAESDRVLSGLMRSIEAAPDR